MTRISSLASNTLLVNQLLKTQNRLFDLQTQVSSEKVSQDYQGIALDSQRLINIENTRDSLKRFVNNNNQMETRLNVTDSVLTGIREIIDNFRKNLDVFQTGSTKDPTRVQAIQEDAFRSLKSLEDLLNTDIDGRFVFAGARVNTEPADFGLTTLADFQATYDGARVTVPTTRDAHLADFSFNKDSTGAANWLVFARDAGGGVSRVTATTAQFTNVKVGTTITISNTAGGVNDGTYTVAAVDPSGFFIDINTEQFTDESPGVATVPISITFQDPLNLNNTVTVNTSAGFTRATNTLTATAGALTGIPVGAKITIAGSTSNNGSFTVDTNDGTNLVIKSKRFTDQGSVGSEVAGTVSATSYFKGDQVTLTHRVDPDRDFEYAINAADPAFEKAIRAMMLILQGPVQSEGGLDQNPERVGQAFFLLQSSIERTVNGTPPFGAELKSNVDQLSIDNAFNQVLLNDTNKRHKEFIGFLDESIAQVENADPLDTITRLLDDQRALEASFQALARIKQLSLINFI